VKNHKTVFSAATKALPNDVELLSFDKWGDDVVVRLHHLFDADEVPSLAAPSHPSPLSPLRSLL
jgi:hypothetical protein